MRKLSIILIILVLTFFTGCSSTSATTPAANAPVQSNSSAGQENTQGKAGNNDQNQSQDKMPDLVGKITAINQNTLEVAELKLPEGMQGAPPAGQRPNGAPGAGGKDPSTMTEQERQEIEQKMKEQKPADAGQSAPGAPEPRGNMAMTYEETGKSYKLQISADTAISQRQMGKDGNAETNITITDLKEGDILRIWVEQLNGDGESTVIRAELMPVRENGSN